MGLVMPTPGLDECLFETGCVSMIPAGPRIEHDDGGVTAMGSRLLAVCLDVDASPASSETFSEEGGFEGSEGRAVVGHPDDVVPRNQAADCFIEIRHPGADPPSLHISVLPGSLAMLILDAI